MRFIDSVPIRRTIQVLLLVWAAFVIFLFIVHHHHWLEYLEQDIPRIFESVFTYVILKLLWMLGFLVLGYGLGRGVLDLFRISRDLDTVEDDLIFSVAVGWGLIGLGTLLLGTLGFLKPALHIILAVVILAATHRQIIRFVRNLKASWTDISLNRSELFLLLVIVTVGIWGLPPSMAPEWGFDSLNSHLPEAATYVREGRIAFHPEINFNNFPQTVEMWFVQSMLVLPDNCAQLIMGVCHLLTTLIVYAMTRRFFGRGPALAAALIYMLIRKVYMFAALAYIDQGATFMIVAGTYAAIRYMEKPSRPLAALTGLMFGFALGCKYTAGINLIVVALAVIVYEPFSHRNGIRLLIDMLIALACLVLVACAWYIRNWIWFHNPVFPFMSDIFPSLGGTYVSVAGELAVDRHKMLEMFLLPQGTRWNLFKFLMLPYTMTFQPFGPYDADEVGALGPWFLIFLPLMIFVRKYPRITWAIVGITVGTYAYWWFGERMLHLRYMLPVYSLQAVFIGFIAWEGLKLDRINPRGFLGWMSMAATYGILVTFFAGLVVPLQIRGQFPILPEERNQFQQSWMNALPAVEGLNMSLHEALGDDELVANTRVYGFFMEQYRWFADFTIIGNQYGYADHASYLGHTRSAKELHDWLKSYNCSYLVVNLPYAREPLGKTADYSVPGLIMDDQMNMPGWEEYFDYQESFWDVFVFRIK
jgi:4-amino-4-deoxy-L-arabinose transferase-like glycosyltransferase